MKLDSWIDPAQAERRLHEAGYEAWISNNIWLVYKKTGVSGRIAITGDGKVDEWCVLRLEDRGS